MAYLGHPFHNAGTPILTEYLERKRLAKIGIVSQASEVAAYKTDCFLVIDTEFEALRARDRQKAAKKR